MLPQVRDVENVQKAGCCKQRTSFQTGLGLFLMTFVFFLEPK